MLLKSLRDMAMKGTKRYIEHNTGDSNAAILNFNGGVQSDSEYKPCTYRLVNQKPDTYLDVRLGERRSRGAIWRWLCLPRSSDIEGHSAAATTSTDLGASTLSATYLGLYFSVHLCTVQKHTFESNQ